MKHPTPQEIAAAITHLCAGQPAELRAAIAAAIQRERDQHRWGAGDAGAADEDATPWISPCEVDGEDGYQVLFGDVIVDWTPHEDSAYHTIGNLIRLHGSAEEVLASMLREMAAPAGMAAPDMEVEADPGAEPVLRFRLRKVLAA